MKFMLWFLGVAVAIDGLLRTLQAVGAERVLWSVWLAAWVIVGFAAIVYGAVRTVTGRGGKMPTPPWPNKKEDTK